jgi:hypothetical protein
MTKNGKITQKPFLIISLSIFFCTCMTKKKWKNFIPFFQVQKNGIVDLGHFSIFQTRTCLQRKLLLISIHFNSKMIYSVGELQDLAVECVKKFIEDADWSAYLPRKRKKSNDGPIDLWQTGAGCSWILIYLILIHGKPRSFKGNFGVLSFSSGIFYSRSV